MWRESGKKSRKKVYGKGEGWEKPKTKLAGRLLPSFIDWWCIKHRLSSVWCFFCCFFTPFSINCLSVQVPPLFLIHKTTDSGDSDSQDWKKRGRWTHLDYVVGNKNNNKEITGDRVSFGRKHLHSCCEVCNLMMSENANRWSHPI